AAGASGASCAPAALRPPAPRSPGCAARGALMLAITAGICGLAAVLAVIVLPRTHPVGSPGEKGADLEDAAGRLDQCPLTPRRLTRHVPDCASGKRRGRAPRSVPRASASSLNRAITRPPPSRSL